MRLAIFDDQRLGVVEGDAIYDVTAAAPGWYEPWPPVAMLRLIAEWERLRPVVLAARAEASGRPLASVTLRSPIPYTSNIVAAPANYRRHVGELGERGVAKVGQSANELGFFLKATSSLVGAGEAIVLPKDSRRRFDHESELAVIVGRTARNVPRAEALGYVFGYACLVDVTMRLEPGAPAEERPTRKSFDTFTPLGPWIVTADEIEDPQALDNQLWVNGEIRHDANTRDMTVGVAALIELASSVMTLRPGDVIASGTPEGVGPIRPGDTVKIVIGGVGAMELPVREADAVAPKVF